MCIKHRCIVTKTRRSKYCHKHLQQLKLPDQLHKSIRQHSKIAAAMIQQNCIADALCHQAISLFCRICLSSAMAGPNRYKVHGMHYAVWLQQDCWNPYAIVFVYLDSQCLVWAGRLLAQVSPNPVLHASHCHHLQRWHCLHRSTPSHIKKMATQHSYKVHFLSVCSFLDSALQGPSWSVDK